MRESDSRITLQRASPLSRGSNDNAEITVREEVCSSRSPKRSSYYVCFWCLLLRTPDDDISNEGWLNDKTGVYLYSFLECTIWFNSPSHNAMKFNLREILLSGMIATFPDKS